MSTSCPSHRRHRCFHSHGLSYGRSPRESAAPGAARSHASPISLSPPTPCGSADSLGLWGVPESQQGYVAGQDHLRGARVTVLKISLKSNSGPDETQVCSSLSKDSRDGRAVGTRCSVGGQSTDRGPQVNVTTNFPIQSKDLARKYAFQWLILEALAK